ncbi:DUF3231 family protein [Neobacillus fumarioli]|uniref:DUF3231 family protein n=1 Tax=Neobacillus fumarioli TaxID=105229 RepID=UPI000833D4FA|nr:DUF3231 family protein [Neobacillus fumarioli]
MNQISASDRLTSPEISNLWTHYNRETLAVCVTKYMMKIVNDPEIHKILQTALEMSENHINILRDLFNKESFPIPKAFTDEDLNLDAPPLFTENFCLSYMHTMTMHGAQSYNIAFNVSIRQDIRNFYYQCNIDTMNLYNQSLDVLMAKNLLNRPPEYKMPEKVYFLSDLSYLTDVFGKRRPMNTIESGNIFFNLEKSILSKALFVAFRQVSKDKDVIKFLDKSIEKKNKHIGLFSNLLLKEDLHTVRTLDTEITTSVISPFSDKLIMFHAGFLIAAAISYYGTAAVASMRADIAAYCERAVMEDLLVYSAFGNLIIQKGWMEQPPFACDRKILPI